MSDIDGLAGVLHRSEEDLRYPISASQPLSALSQEFAHSTNHLRKLSELGKKGYAHFRRVRGDGNCFYRAVGFAWLEALDARARRGKDIGEVLPGRWPDPSSFGGLAQEYYELREEVWRMVQGDHPSRTRETSHTLFLRLVCDIRFDLCVVVLMRRIVAGFFDRSPEDETAAMILETVQAQYGSLEAFASDEVLPMGREAEGATLAIAARELRVRMRIMQLDASEGRMPSYVYPSEDYTSPFGIRICLLFRPGHYEVLYPERVERLPESPTLHGRCSFCRDVASLPSGGLLTCFHRLCTHCTSQSRMRGGIAQCPICSEVPLPDHVRAHLEHRSGPDQHTLSSGMPSPTRLTEAYGPTACQSDGRSNIGTLVTPPGPFRPGNQLPPPQTMAALPQTRMDLSSQQWSPQPEKQCLKPPGTTTTSIGYYDRQTATFDAGEAQAPSSLQHAPSTNCNGVVPAAVPGSGFPEPSAGLNSSFPEPLSGRQSSFPEPPAGLRSSFLEPSAGRQSSFPEPLAGQPRPGTMSSFPEPPAGLTSSFPEPPAGLLRPPQTGVLSSKTSNSAYRSGGSFSNDKPMYSGNASFTGSTSGNQLAPPRTAMQSAHMPANDGLTHGLARVESLHSGCAGTAQLMPQTEASLLGHRATGVRGAACCFRCGNGSDLRRVKCCEKHYCCVCLKNMITEAQSDTSLRCSYCGAPWDLEALSTACDGNHSRTATPGRQKASVSPRPSFGRESKDTIAMPQAGYDRSRIGKVTRTGPGAKASASDDGYHASASVGGFKADGGIAEIKSASASAGIGQKGMNAGATGAEIKLTDAVGAKLLDGNAKLSKDGASAGVSLAEVAVGPVQARLGAKVGLDKDGIHLGMFSVKPW